MRIHPPDLSSTTWNDLPAWEQALLLGYDLVRSHEEINFAAGRVGL